MVTGVTTLGFRAEDAEVSAILKDGNTYYVPIFQRGYSWTTEEVGRLLDDLAGSILDGDKEYFLGAIVIRPGADGKSVIVDGQQRLATITMILANLRDRLHSLGHTDDALEVQRSIWPSTFGKQEERFIHLREPDDTSFKRAVQDYPHSEAADPKSLIGRASSLIHNFISEPDAPKVPLTRDELIEWVSFLRQSVRFVVVRVGDDMNAYQIFETLNDRGLDLAVEDLLRNHLCARSGSEEYAKTEVLPIWEEMIEHLSEVGVRPSNFLRHYWLSKWAVIRKQSLYREYQKYVNTSETNPKEFAVALCDSAELYSGLINPGKDEPGQAHLRSLTELGVTQSLPFLLAVKETGSEKEFVEASILVESISAIYSVIGKKNPNRLERKYSEWAIGFRKKSLDVDSIRKDAKSLCSTQEIQAAFDQDTPQQFAVTEAKFLLRRITEHLLGDELTVAGGKKVHLEHIIPKKPAEGLPLEEPNRLGNLTLMLGLWNQKISNHPFAAKKKAYLDSKIPITTPLSELTAFEENDIKGREAWLCEIAMKIWNI